MTSTSSVSSSGYINPTQNFQEKMQQDLHCKNEYLEKLDVIVEECLRKTPVQPGETYTFTLQRSPYRSTLYVGYGQETGHKTYERITGTTDLEMTYIKDDKPFPHDFPATALDTFNQIFNWMKQNPLPKNQFLRLHLQPGLKVYIPVNVQPKHESDNLNKYESYNVNKILTKDESYNLNMNHKISDLTKI